ncbi:hypothetical protein EC9_26940 [Rosistilla ulvae]|uniref:Plasmid stabilization system protein n=1 Tax=Rosistilla ulvae TaxID=1930277 RepID=A0A517M0U8_9BACT|nr:hypothetical protein EC9_26940 [Rosistilla ulvae]
MWHLSYRPEIENDVVAAVTWYDDKQIGLGDYFPIEYLADVRRICDTPLLFAIAANGLRPCRLKRFSYVIHFDVDGKEILIVASIAGGRDDPAFVHRNG